MKTKKLNRKLRLNKKTISNLYSADMLNLRGGAATQYGDSCFAECQWEPGHTEYGHTCYELCETYNIMCE
ncbi:MAG: class I lanthipeptide [Candidatus Aminicenantes bacterium]|jgi:hypothetical protein